MTPTPRVLLHYEHEKRKRIEELHAAATRHMDEFERLMREIDALERETVDEAYADDRSKEWREMREEQRKLESDRG